MTTGQELKEIVEALNQPLFGMDLSLVSLDEKQPFEQVELLNDVLIKLDEKHKVDVREEIPQGGHVDRMSEFLHTLGYPGASDISFAQGLATGDKRVIHPMLHWMLTNFDAIKKRAYLAKYCVIVEVPEDIMQEEAVYEIYQEYNHQQNQFKATHAHLEQLRVTMLDPSELKREIHQLVQESDQLTQKIQQFQNQTKNNPGFLVLLNATSQLRKEQEEEARITEKVMDLKNQLDQTQQYYMESRRRLQDLKEDTTNNNHSAEQMLKHLREEVVKNRTMFAHLVREKDEKTRRINQVEAALSEPPVTNAQISHTDMEIDRLKHEIQILEGTVNKQSESDGKLAIYRQQANLVTRKKEIALKEKATLERERDRLLAELTGKEKEYEEFKGHKFLNRDEFKQYANTLRDKTAKFKAHKNELAEIRQEVAVLNRTEQVLTKRATEYNIEVDELEKQKGVAGWANTEEKLNEVSEKKRAVDNEKGQTLNEISKIVEEINAQIRIKKDKLAPQIKVLRKVRQEYQVVEAEFVQKKGVFDGEKMKIDQETGRLMQELQELEKKRNAQERQFFNMTVMHKVAERQRQRAAKEDLCRNGTTQFNPDMPNFTSLTQYYTAQLSKATEEQSKLRSQKKEVDSQFPESQKQKQMFASLQRLLEHKQKVSTQTAQDMDKSAEHFRAALDHSVAGVNRLVVD